MEGGKYAVFLHTGPYEHLRSVYEEIGDWIVENAPRLREQPMFEKNLNIDPRDVDPKALKTEIHVPLQ